MIPSRQWSRLWSAGEILVLTALFFFCLWGLGPRVSRGEWHGAFLVLLGAGLWYVIYFSPCRIHGDRLSDRGIGSLASAGIRMDNFLRASVEYGSFTVCGIVLLLGFAAIVTPGRLLSINWLAVCVKFSEYVPLVLCQTLFFYAFLYLRLRCLLARWEPESDTSVRRRHRLLSSFVMAVLFSGYHLPNAPLMALTFCAGFGWAWIFYATPNLFALTVSHTLLGVVLHRIILLPMRVGPFYWQPDLYILRTLFPWLRVWIGNLY